MNKLKKGTKVKVKNIGKCCGSPCGDFKCVGKEGVVYNVEVGGRIHVMFDKYNGCSAYASEDLEILDKKDIKEYGIVKFLRRLENEKR